MPFVLVNIFIKSYMTFFYGIHPPKDYILNDIEIKINKTKQNICFFFNYYLCSTDFKKLLKGLEQHEGK